jgi:hypothetical protein
MKQNQLVDVVFSAIRKADATPQQRKSAVIRAGLIAQAYNDSDCIEEIFSPLPESLNNHEESHPLSLGENRS